MSETKHTPTARPWTGALNSPVPIVRRAKMPHGEADTFYATVHGSTEIVCRLDFGYGRPNDEANAAMIVLAVNSHDELLEACESATEELQTLFMTPSNLGRGIGERLMAVHAKLKAAIKKAGR